MQRKWTSAEDEFLRTNFGTMTRPELGQAVDRSPHAIRSRLSTLGLTGGQRFTDEDRAAIRLAYEGAGDKLFDLAALAHSLNRRKESVSREARKMGLTIKGRTLPNGRKDRSMFKGDERALSEHRSRKAKERLDRNGHPRGMAGKKHTDETKEKLGRISVERWQKMTQSEREAQTNKAVITRIKNGSGPPKVKRGTWAAGWREIGDRRIYFRSRWEANYARYLDWLRARGDIEEWEYEPVTFWFEKIRRGVRSYKPDFRVREKNGAVVFHEVKGWMDARSRTALKRMAKYYPEETVILIEAASYKSIKRTMHRMIEGWEYGNRD